MLRMRAGSSSVAPAPSRDIQASKPRVCVSAAEHAVVGWYPTGCCASGQ